MSVLDLDKKIEELEIKIEELRKISTENNIDLTCEIEKMEKKLLELRNDLSSKLTPWDRVVLARMNDRPTSLDYIEMIFDDFIEFHGDRLYGDDPAIVGGIATLDGIPVTVIGEQKGRNTKENLYRNFGMPHPEGYRKALRLMKQAEKFKRPIITFIDTPGAYCGIGAEERGQAEAIARNLMEMSTIDILKIAIVIGEGSSGGALAISVADEIWMLENAVYSILSPEGFASILWKDASRAKEAADVMKMTAYDLKELGIINKIIKEPAGGAHKAPQMVADEIKRNLIAVIKG
ncbi:MAG: accA [Caloramator sp.]|jgi:acetyl-CoA carboxylase carboxyl transferase subunit alpha|uniref:acetyl-CoA carboxylase carboxyltransferase subunit alpha n=1 Tax=Caloramator sp. TaxID=1871330 RepID=UPI001E039BB4|nr:accA [Caloramator sp.]